MSADPEDLLKDLPPESPPPEMVLAAVRVFRYRALAAVAMTIALLIAGIYLVQRLQDDSRFLVQVARAAYENGEVGAGGIGEVRTVDGTSLVVWDVVSAAQGPGPRSVYVHLIGWGDQPTTTALEIDDLRSGDVPARVVGEEGGGGGVRGAMRYDLWFEVERTTPGPLTFDAQVVRLRPAGGSEVVASVPFEIDM